jgi:hypothetical protein
MPHLQSCAQGVQLRQRLSALRRAAAQLACDAATVGLGTGELGRQSRSGIRRLGLALTSGRKVSG